MPVQGKEKKKILFACPFPPPYTGKTVGSQIIRDLLKDRFDYDTFGALEGRGTGRAGKFSIRQVIVTLKCLFVLRRMVRNTSYDVFYFTPGSSTLGHIRDIILMELVRSRVTSTIAHIHVGNFHQTLGKRWFKPLSRRFVRHVDRFIFLSRDLSDRSSGLIPDARRAVIHNPIDVCVQLSQKEWELKISERMMSKEFNILFLSNMIESKGYRDVARALLLLSARLNWRAHFVGDWENIKKKKEFEDYLSKNGIGERVRVHGGITDRSEIKKRYREADVFVLPTYYPQEAQPLSILEAMNAATPIISTRHASIPEYVTDGYNGLFVTKKTPREIARAVEHFADRDNWLHSARAARKTYERFFSTEVIQEQLIALFLNTPTR